MVDSDEETPSVPTYSQEQRTLKEDLKSALNSAVGEEEEPLLTLRSKTDNEKVRLPLFFKLSFSIVIFKFQMVMK